MSNTPNYSQSDVVGCKWRRIFRFAGENPYGPSSSLVLNEEEIIVDTEGNVLSAKPVDAFHVIFDISNPKHLAVYEALNAVYTEERELRDTVVGAI